MTYKGKGGMKPRTKAELIQQLQQAGLLEKKHKHLLKSQLQKLVELTVEEPCFVDIPFFDFPFTLNLWSENTAEL
jgi:hypothetical protein